MSGSVEPARRIEVEGRRYYEGDQSQCRAPSVTTVLDFVWPIRELLPKPAHKFLPGAAARGERIHESIRLMFAGTSRAFWPLQEDDWPFMNAFFGVFDELRDGLISSERRLLNSDVYGRDIGLGGTVDYEGKLSDGETVVDFKSIHTITPAAIFTTDRQTAGYARVIGKPGIKRRALFLTPAGPKWRRFETSSSSEPYRDFDRAAQLFHSTDRAGLIQGSPVYTERVVTFKDAVEMNA